MEHLFKVYVVVFVISLSNLRHSAFAANLGGCKLSLENGDPLDDNSWTFDHTVPKPLKDTASAGDIVYTYACQDVDSITKGESTQPSPGVDYVTYQLSADKTQLTVVVTPAFQNYEENEVIAGLTLNTPVTFQCKNGASDLKFRVNVELSNNNFPSFAAGTEDTMTLSMPYPNGLKVTTVTVTDVDLGNVDVTLTLDAVGNENFQILAPRVNGKVYEFDLLTKKQIYLESLLQVVVTAKDNSQGVQNQAVATLKFEPDLVLSTPPSPRFTDALSLGDISDQTPVGSEIPLTPAITFSEGFDPAEVTLTISSAVNADASLFEVKMVGSTATVVLKAALPDDVLKEAFVILVIQADRPSAANTGRTVVHLSLPAQETTTTTESTTTTGSTPTTTECPPVVTCPTTEAPTTCPECPTDGTTEAPTTCPECPTDGTTVVTSCPTTEAPTTCPECPTDGTTVGTTCPTTEAPTTCPECPTDGTTVVITCPTTEAPTTCPECPTDGTTTECPTVTCPTLPTECPVTCEDCPTDGTTSEGTTESSSTCPVCPTDCPETSTGTTGTSTGTTATSTGTTGTECPTTTPGVTDCPVDCSQCPTDGSTTCEGTSTTTTTSTTTQGTTTPGVDEGTLVFEEDSYEAEVGPVFIGTVLRVTAKADPDRPVTYKLETTSTVIQNRVTVDPLGNVDANKLPPGTFAFTVSATVDATSLYAYTTVTIRVQSTSLCGDVPQFEYALSVISILENVQQVVIPGMTAVDGTDCVYSLDSDEYFSIDSATGALTSKKVDRESEMFVDMETPQVSVHLTVQCAEHEPLRSLHAQVEHLHGLHGNMTEGQRIARDTRLDYSEIESVESNKQNMAVVAIIEDANDNAPIFTPTSPLVVGYPSQELMVQLNPTSLVTVLATDLDAGINAEIEYSLDPETPEGRFFVHPTSGTVYVLASESTFTDQEFNVLATDQAGEGETCEQPLNIKMKIVTRSQLTEVLIEGALLEQVNAVLEAMAAKTGFVVRSFAASVVPSLAASSATTTTAATTGETSRMRRDLVAADQTSQSLLRLVVYAIDQQQQVVPSDEFKTQMQAFDSWTVQDIRQLESNSEPSDNSGLVAAVISLGVIVLLMLVAAGVVFFLFYLRPRMNRDRHLQDLINDGYEDSNSDVTSSSAESSKNLDVEADGKTNITSWLHVSGDSQGQPEAAGKTFSSDFAAAPNSPQQTAVNIEGHNILSQFIMPASLEAYNNPIGGNLRTYPGDSESEDDVRADDEFGTRKKGERKKSVVTFNESVDCIEIEKM